MLEKTLGKGGSRPRKRVHPIALLVAALFAILGAGACVLGLRALDYSRADLEFLDPEEIAASASLPRVGALSWETEQYEIAPELEPLRAFVRRECALPRDRDIVICVVAAMAARFPHGEPRIEFVDAAYDPAAALDAHLAGERGHCVTRSGLAAAALLASGIPARVVQLFPSSGAGHNVFSYFDREAQQWVLVDPTYGVRVHQPGRDSLASLVRGDRMAFAPLAHAPAGIVADAATVYRDLVLVDGHALYPEPWLYTRVGPRVATFPYTAHYIVIGAPTLMLGWGHWLYRVAALSLALLAVVLGAAWIAGFQRRGRQLVATSAGRHEQELASMGAGATHAVAPDRAA